MRSIRLKSKNTKKLFVLGFLGIIGTGKTTTAYFLSEKLGLTVINTDKVKRFLNNHGYPGVIPHPELELKINQAASRFLYEKKISHIIDADLTRFYKKTEDNARPYKAELLLIRLTCPEKVLLERLKKRDEDLAGMDADNFSMENSETGWSLSGEKDFHERVELFKTIIPPEDVYFTIDTSKDLDIQAEKLEEKLKEDKYL